MQKLRKSIENNILKSILKDGSVIFNVESNLGRDLKSSPITYINKNLTTNSCRRLKSLYNLEIYHFQSPINLKVFDSHEDLNQYFNFLHGKEVKENTIVTNRLNVIYKDSSYLAVKNVNSKQTYLKLKNLLNPQKNIIKVLNLRINKS